MKRDYAYTGNPRQVYEQIQDVLDTLGYSIEYRLPETLTLVTVKQKVKQDVRVYEYSLIITVRDWIDVTVTGGKYVYKRSSEKAIAGKSLTEFHTLDRLPYSIQENIFEPLEYQFKKYGWKRQSK